MKRSEGEMRDREAGGQGGGREEPHKQGRLDSTGSCSLAPNALTLQPSSFSQLPSMVSYRLSASSQAAKHIHVAVPFLQA